MRIILSLILSGFFLSHNVSHSADSSQNNDAAVYVFTHGDFLDLIFTRSDFDYSDLVSMSMVTKSARKPIIAAIVRLQPKEFICDGAKAAQYTAIFERIMRFKAAEWKYDRPLVLKEVSKAESGAILEALLKITCISTTNYTVESTVPESWLINHLLLDKPNMTTLKMNTVDLPLGAAQCIGEAVSLAACSFSNASVNLECLTALARSSSLTDLSINNFFHSPQSDGHFVLPKNLKVLKIEGIDLGKGLFSAVGALKNLTSFSAHSSYQSQSLSQDISSELQNILNLDLSELEVRGLYVIDRDTIKACMQKNYGSTGLFVNKDTEGKQHTQLSLRPKAHNLSVLKALLPSTEVDVAIDIIKTKLAQGKGLLLHVDDNGNLNLHELDRENKLLSIQINNWNNNLADLLNKLDDDMPISLNITNADSLVIDDRFMTTLARKKWDELLFTGQLSVVKNAFSCFKVNAPFIQISFDNSADNRQSLRIGRETSTKSSTASLKSNGKPISRDMVLAVTNIPKIDHISITGTHELTPADLNALITTYGFKGINVSATGIKDIGGIADFDTMAIQLDTVENPFLIFNRSQKRQRDDLLPRVIISGNEANSTSPELMEFISKSDMKTLVLPRITLSKDMARALKSCASLNTLRVANLDPTISPSDMPKVSALEFSSFNDHIATTLSHMPGPLTVSAQVSGGEDIASFIPWARANKHIQLGLMSLTGDNNGFFIRIIFVGAIPKQYKSMFGQSPLGAAAPEGHQLPANFVPPPQETEITLIDSDLSNEELVKLKNQPGLVKLDVRGSMSVSLVGIGAVLQNPALKELILPSTLIKEAGGLTAQFPKVHITFAD